MKKKFREYVLFNDICLLIKRDTSYINSTIVVHNTYPFIAVAGIAFRKTLYVLKVWTGLPWKKVTGNSRA